MSLLMSDVAYHSPILWSISHPVGVMTRVLPPLPIAGDSEILIRFS